VIEVFLGALDLAGFGLEGVEPEATGRPAYHPATMLKLRPHRNDLPRRCFMRNDKQGMSCGDRRDIHSEILNTALVVRTSRYAEATAMMRILFAPRARSTAHCRRFESRNFATSVSIC
jgi:hypothetical protein